MNTSTIDTTSTLLSPAASGNSSLGPTPFPPPGMSGVPQPPVTVADGCVIAFMFGLWFYSLYLTYRLDKFSGLWSRRCICTDLFVAKRRQMVARPPAEKSQHFKKKKPQYWNILYLIKFTLQRSRSRQ